MAREFIRQFKNTTKQTSSLYTNYPNFENRITADNYEETAGYRYWISPITKIDNNDNINLLIPVRFYKQKYLSIFLDKVPLPVRFYNKHTNLNNVYNDREYNNAKIFFYYPALFKQTFDILNITASYENSSYPVSNIHNDNIHEYYINDSSDSQTITIEVVNPDIFKYLTLYTEYDENYTYQDVSNIEVSPDGTNWTSITFSTVFDYSYSGLYTKRIKVYGNFNSYPSDTKFIRLTIPSGMKINKIALHKDNNGLLFNDKVYFRIGNSDEDIFACSSTNNLGKYNLKPYPVPKNKSYNPDTDILNIDETINITDIPNDSRIVLPQMKFKFRKRRIWFNIDNIGTVKNGLNATLNAIFYPAKRITYTAIKTETRKRTLVDVKEVVIPNQGKIKTDAERLAFMHFDGNGDSTTWKSGLARIVKRTTYFEENNIFEATSTDNISNSRNPDIYAGLITEANLQDINHTFKSHAVINGEVFYPSDIANINPGDFIAYNNIERFEILGWSDYIEGRGTLKIEFKDLSTLERQSVESDFVILDENEIPYELVLEYPENSLKVMISVDGNTWYGIDRNNDTIQAFTNIDETIIATNGFYVYELNRLLPNLKLLDSNYNNQIKFYFYLPYSEVKYKSMYIWLRTFNGHYIRQLYSFDNGSTWKRYNPVSQQFEDITFTDNLDAYNNATTIPNLPVDKFPDGTTNVVIKYLIKSNYDFDIPEFLTNTRYVTKQPSRIIRKAFEGNLNFNINDIFNITNRWSTGFWYLYKDSVYVITQDKYTKTDRYKVYLLRGIEYTTGNLNHQLSYDIGINDGETINYLLHLSKRDKVKPFMIKLLGIEILETGIKQGNNVSVFEETKDLRQIKYLSFTRNNTDINLTITWNDNSTYGIQLQNYQQQIDEVVIKFYNNKDNYMFELWSDRAIYENYFDIINEVPLEYQSIYYSYITCKNWPYTEDWYKLIFGRAVKFIISGDDGNTWYGIDKTLQPITINNPNSYEEIEQKGISEIDFIRYGIDNWKSLLNIPNTSNEYLVKIRNTKKPLSFIPYGYLKHDITEYYAISTNTQHTISLKKLIL